MFAPELTNYTLALSHDDAAGEVYIAVSNDRLSVRMALRKSGDTERKHSLRTIRKLLVIARVTAPTEDTLIEDMIDRLHEPYSATDYVEVAVGTPPVNGEDSRLRPLFPLKQCDVSRGQELATMVPPTEGRDGVDVFGAPIPCKPGRFVEAKLGENVRLDAGSNKIVAVMDGFASVVGNAVAVSPVFQIQLSEDKYQATVSFEGAGATYDDLLNLLNSLGIVHGIQEDTLRSALAGGTEAKDWITLVAAEGERPHEGENGEVEFFFARKHCWDTVDSKHWKVQLNNPLAMFQPGEKLLRVNPCIPGIPGINVLGEETPVAEVHNVAVVPGDSVIAEESVGGMLYLAKKRGAPVFTGNVLNIVEEYVVAGDLHQDSGYIDFGGNVVVKGDVLSGSAIRSEGNIVVKGTVYDAALKADGDITVNSGISGARGGKVVCGGSLTAKYLDNSYVEAGGDIVIANEIIASNLYCLGAIRCPGGVIYGGEVVAYKGVQAKYLGNANSIQTNVSTGKDYTLPPVIEEIEKAMSLLRDEKDVISDQLQYYKDHPSIMANMPAQQKAVIKTQLMRLSEIGKLLEARSNEIKGLKQNEYETGVREISVGKNIYPGVYLEVGVCNTNVRMPVSGPVKVIADEGKVSFVSHSHR